MGGFTKLGKPCSRRDSVSDSHSAPDVWNVQSAQWPFQWQLSGQWGPGTIGNKMISGPPGFVGAVEARRWRPITWSGKPRGCSSLPVLWELAVTLTGSSQDVCLIRRGLYTACVSAAWPERQVSSFLAEDVEPGALRRYWYLDCDLGCKPSNRLFHVMWVAFVETRGGGGGGGRLS